MLAEMPVLEGQTEIAAPVETTSANYYVAGTSFNARIISYGCDAEQNLPLPVVLGYGEIAKGELIQLTPREIVGDNRTVLQIGKRFNDGQFFGFAKYDIMFALKQLEAGADNFTLVLH